MYIQFNEEESIIIKKIYDGISRNGWNETRNYFTDFTPEEKKIVDHFYSFNLVTIDKDNFVEMNNNNSFIISKLLKFSPKN